MRYWIFFVLILGTVAAAAQQNPDGRIPLGGLSDPYLLLLHDPVVHQELKLDAAQRKALGRLCDETDVEYWAVRNKSPQESEEISRRLRSAAQKRLAGVLTETQQKRLREIEARTIGLQVLLRADMAERVGLSEANQEKVRSILQRNREAVASLEKELRAGTPRGEVEPRFRALRQEEQREVLDSLTADQKSRLAAAVGPPIDLERLGRIKLKPPEFPDEQVWINSSPLTLKQLRGNVVVLFYWTYG